MTDVSSHSPFRVETGEQEEAATGESVSVWVKQWLSAQTETEPDRRLVVANV